MLRHGVYSFIWLGLSCSNGYAEIVLSDYYGGRWRTELAMGALSSAAYLVLQFLAAIEGM